MTPQEALAYNRSPLRLTELDAYGRAEVLAEIECWGERQTPDQARWLLEHAPRISPIEIARKIQAGAV